MQKCRNVAAGMVRLVLILTLLWSQLNGVDAHAGTTAGGLIATDTTWSLAQSPVVVTSNILVASGVALTIDPGVHVEFAAGTFMRIEGALRALGTSSNRIVFTSSRSAKAQGDWAGIQVRSTGGTAFDGTGAYVSGSQIKFVAIEYASTALYVSGTGISLKNANFANNSVGVELRSSRYSRIENSHFESNCTGIFSEYDVAGYGALVDAKILNNTFRGQSSSCGETKGIALNLNQRALKGLEISGNSFSSFQGAGVVLGGGGYGPYAHSVLVADNTFKNSQSGLAISTFYSQGCNGLDPCPPLPDYPIDIQRNLFIGVENPLTVAGVSGVTVRVQQNVIDAPGRSIQLAGQEWSTRSKLFSGNSVIGARVRIWGSSQWRLADNLFSDINAVTIDIESGTGHSVEGNSFVRNTGAYVIRNQTTAPVAAVGNYWGTAVLAEVAAKIFDATDDFDKGPVAFNPIVANPVATTPLPPVTGIKLVTTPSGDLKLEWSLAIDSRVTGYRIHHDAKSGYPYAEVLDTGNTTSRVFTGYGANVRYFAVTAYDGFRDGTADWTEGHESWLSLPVSNASAAVTPEAVTLSVAAGSGSVMLSHPGGAVSWTASSSVAWATVTPSTGSGSGSLTFTHDARGPYSSARNAVLTIAGQSVTLTQPGTAPSFGVSVASWSATAAGGSTSVTVTSTTVDAAWTASSSAAWLAVAPTTGTGGSSVTLTAAATTSASSRTAVVTIAGQTVTVTQAAGTPTFTVSPSAPSIPAAGGNQALTVTSSLSDAPWSATSTASWLTVSPPSRTGTDTVTLTAAATTSTASRTATVTIAGQTVAVTQAAGENIFTVTPNTLVLSGAGGAAPVTLSATTTDAPWSASSSAPWLSVAPASGTGEATVTLTASPQAFGAPARGATVTIAGQTVAVQQQATTEPGPPRQLTASLADTRLVLRWTAPDSGGPLGLYLLEYGFAPGRTDGASVNVGTAQVFAVNLPPGRFFIRVKAQNAYGISAASNEVEIRVGITGEPPGRPQSLTARVTGGSAALSWTAPAGGDPPTGYQLEAGTALGLSNIASVPLGFDTSIAFEGIPPGLYFVRVRGLNSFGVGAASEEAILAVGGAAEPPLRPTGLIATVTGAAVSFRWNAPTAGGAPTGYLLEAGTGMDLSNITTLPLPNVATFGVDGVPAGRYFVRVRATNALGASAPSNEVTVNVGAGDRLNPQPATSAPDNDEGLVRPGPPSQLRGWVTGHTVQLAWNAPLARGAVTGYRVDVAASADGPSVWSTTTADPSLVVAPVPPGTYYVRVVSVRAAVSSTASNVLLVLVP